MTQQGIEAFSGQASFVELLYGPPPDEMQELYGPPPDPGSLPDPGPLPDPLGNPSSEPNGFFGNLTDLLTNIQNHPEDYLLPFVLLAGGFLLIVGLLVFAIRAITKRR